MSEQDKPSNVRVLKTPPAPIDTHPKGIRAAWKSLDTTTRVVGGVLLLIGTVIGGYAAWDDAIDSRASVTEVRDNEKEHAKVHAEHDAAINNIDRRTVRLETTMGLVQQDVRRIADRMSIPAPQPSPHPTVTPGEP